MNIVKGENDIKLSSFFGSGLTLFLARFFSSKVAIKSYIDARLSEDKGDAPEEIALASDTPVSYTHLRAHET